MQQPPAPTQLRHSLPFNAAYAIVGTGFFHACNLVVLVLLAKLGSATIQGQYLYSVALATPVVLLLSFELRGALVADAGNEFQFRTYRRLRSRLMVCAAAVLAVIATWRAVVEPHTSLAVITVGVFGGLIAYWYAEVSWGAFQRHERMDLLAGGLALRGIALVTPFATLMLLARAEVVDPAVAAAVAAILYALGSIVVYGLYDRRMVRAVSGRADSSGSTDVWALARQTFPLGLVALTINLCEVFPRLVIEGSGPDGKAQLGYFGSLAYITLAGNLLIIQTCNAAANRLSAHFQQDLAAFGRLLTRLILTALGVGAAVLLVVWLVGPWLLRVLFTPEYAVFEAEFRLIAGAHAIALVTNVLGATTTQMRLFWAQVPIQGITLATTVVAALLLIPGGDPVRGAAETAMVRAIVQCGLYGIGLVMGFALRERLLSTPSSRRGTEPPAP